MGSHTFTIQSDGTTRFIDITAKISDLLDDEGLTDGMCVVYVPHTTAGVTINEAADPAVKHDMMMTLEKMVPFRDNYTHAEGNSAAHVKASLMGSSVSIPVSRGRLSLGTWQGIFFCEFDGPRRRSVHCSFNGS